MILKCRKENRVADSEHENFEEVRGWKLFGDIKDLDYGFEDQSIIDGRQIDWYFNTLDEELPAKGVYITAIRRDDTVVRIFSHNEVYYLNNKGKTIEKIN